ncbi:MAG TPA: hypothetical protein VFZ01_10805 [Geminicoccaceae bacterium]
MFKFLIGLVVGVFIGVLVVAPNPDLSARVQEFWVDARAWGTAFWSAAEQAADDVAGQVEEGAEEVGEGIGDAAREAEEATQ